MITNSPKAELPAGFEDWFSESRITETWKAGGKPIRVYHGTRQAFSRFRVSERGSFGSGIYFASTRAQAELFGGEDDNTIVMEAFLLMRRPYHFRIREPEIIDTWGEGLVLDLFEAEKAKAIIQDSFNSDGQFGKEITEHLSALGHDGIVATFSDGSQELVVFEPGQVMLTSGSVNENLNGHESTQARPVAPEGDYEHRALQSYMAGDEVTLYHGTTQERAKTLLEHGSMGPAPVGANQGKKSLLYVTTHPENATWYAQQSGDSVVLSVRIPASRLGCDPEDGVHETVMEELKAADRTGIPASLVVWGSLAASAFSLELRSPAPAKADEGDNWLVEKKIEDAEGFPRMVYHGTNAEFEAFDLAKSGSNFDHELSRQGIFFTAERYVAESVADQVTEEYGGKARVVQACLSLKNPARIDMTGIGDDAWVLRLLQEAKLKGHDGAVIENWRCAISAKPETQYVAFHESLIKIVAPEKLSTPGAIADFDAWIAGTKVTNLAGQPQIVFHGTADDFSEFSGVHQGKRHVDLEIGDAFFFTDDVKTANWYAKSAAKAAGGTGANVIPVYLAMPNPMIVDFQGTGIETLAEDIEQAKKLGYDGLIARNYDDGSVSDHFIAFHPGQIRPALAHAGRPVLAAKPPITKSAKRKPHP